jgi:hypothetical protein
VIKNLIPAIHYLKAPNLFLHHSKVHFTPPENPTVFQQRNFTTKEALFIVTHLCVFIPLANFDRYLNSIQHI